MYETSSLQFLVTTTGIQSRPGVFDKSRLVMNFLTILGVNEINGKYVKRYLSPQD